MNKSRGECYICGIYGPVERHHLDWHHSHDERLNIIVLCPRCHSELHKGGYLSREELSAIREKVKARQPERFAKTLWDILGNE